MKQKISGQISFNILKGENHKEMLNLDNIDFEAKKLAAMVRMRAHCFNIYFSQKNLTVNVILIK